MINWLNSEDRWHDIGHAMFAYFIVTWLGLGTGIWWLGAVIIIGYVWYKEMKYDTYQGQKTIYDFLEYAIGILIALVLIYRVR